MSTSLWGTLPSPDHSTHIRSILMEQGTFLAELTGGVLRAETSELDESVLIDNIAFSLGFSYDIVCPSFHGYQYRVCNVYYNLIPMYPCCIAPPGLRLPGCDQYMSYDEESFRSNLQKTLSGPRVHTAVAALLREANR